MNDRIMKIINDLKSSIDEAVRHREIWWELGCSKNRAEFKHEFASIDYNHFLHASYEAHAVTMFLSLGRIFDNDTRTSSFRSLKYNLKESGHAQISTLIETQLKPHEKSVQKILDIRSRTIAHADTSYTERAILLDNPISHDEIKALILDTRATFYNVLNYFHLNTKQLADEIYSEATINVLRQLKPNK